MLDTIDILIDVREVSMRWLEIFVQFDITKGNENHFSDSLGFIGDKSLFLYTEEWEEFKSN